MLFIYLVPSTQDYKEVPSLYIEPATKGVWSSSSNVSQINIPRFPDLSPVQNEVYPPM